MTHTATAIAPLDFPVPTDYRPRRTAAAIGHAELEVMGYGSLSVHGNEVPTIVASPIVAALRSAPLAKSAGWVVDYPRSAKLRFWLGGQEHIVELSQEADDVFRLSVRVRTSSGSAWSADDVLWPRQIGYRTHATAAAAINDVASKVAKLSAARLGADIPTVRVWDDRPQAGSLPNSKRWHAAPLYVNGER